MPSHTKPLGVPVAALGLGLLAAAFGMWLAGTVTTWAWVGRRPSVPLAGAVALFVRSLAAAGHPRRAWPAGSRLPPSLVLGGAEGVGACAGLALLILAIGLARSHPGSGARRPRPQSSGGVGGLAAGLWLRRGERPGARPAPGGGWARRADLAILRVPAATPGRLTLGRLDQGYRRSGGRGLLLAAEARASIVVLGPSQSGKTTGLAVPAILEWAGPVVATSVKTDLVADTIGSRSQRGLAWIYDPTGVTGLPAAGWSPLAACGTWQGARRTAAWLCGAGRGHGGSGDEDFWYAAAGKLLAPYLLAAALSGRDLAQVVLWIDAQEELEVAQLLEKAGACAALGAAGASWQRDDRTRSSVFTTAEMVLEAYADPGVLSSAMTSDVDPGLLVGGGSPTLYLCAPAHEQERLRPVFATLLQTILTAAFDTALRQGHPLDPPLLVVLDEAANIAPLRDLDALASTAAGHGVQLVTVWQDLAQLRARYGERAATVVNNHRAKVVNRGALTCPNTRRRWSEAKSSASESCWIALRASPLLHGCCTPTVPHPRLVPSRRPICRYPTRGNVLHRPRRGGVPPPVASVSYASPQRRTTRHHATRQAPASNMPPSSYGPSQSSGTTKPA